MSNQSKNTQHFFASTIMNWFVNLPENVSTALLSDQLLWDDLARLDSALCIKSFRPLFLARLKTDSVVSRIKLMRHHEKDYEDAKDVSRYLNWVNLRNVLSTSRITIDDPLQPPHNLEAWGTFDNLTHIEVEETNPHKLDFANRLWEHCPNLKIARYCPFDCDGNYYQKGVITNTTFLPLFRACRKLQKLTGTIVSLSMQEAEEVPRTLKRIELYFSNRSPEIHNTDELVHMVGRLNELQQLELHLECWSMPPSLYTSVCNSKNTLTQLVLYKCGGTVGVEVMLAQCVHLTHLGFSDCTDLTQEAFTMIFELPCLKYLSLSRNETLTGLLPRYAATTTTSIQHLNITLFLALYEHDEEQKRVLQACPLLVRGFMYSTLSETCIGAYPELCLKLRDYQMYMECQEIRKKKAEEANQAADGSK